jgi:putative transposase
MSVRDVKAQLHKTCMGLSLSRTDFQSHRCGGRGTKLWQNRGLDRVYPIVYFDAIVVKVRQRWAGEQGDSLSLGVKIWQATQGAQACG